MKQVSSEPFDIFYIDCSLYTNMCLRWERRVPDRKNASIFPYSLTHTPNNNWNKNANSTDSVHDTLNNSAMPTNSFIEHSVPYTILQEASSILSTHSIKQGRAEKLPLICEELRNHCGGSYRTLKAVCVCMGPGSFTGIRSALAFAKGLCAASFDTHNDGNDIYNTTQLITVNAFECIAQSYRTYRPLLMVCDARSNRYFYKLALEHTNNHNDIFEYENNVLLESLDLDELATYIESLKKQHDILYIAGEDACLIHQYYTQSHNKETTLMLPAIDWDTIHILKGMTVLGFQKYLTGDFSNMNCVPLYGKNYL